MALQKSYAKLYVTGFACSYGMGNKVTTANAPGEEVCVGLIGLGNLPKVADGFLHYFATESDGQTLMPRAVNLNCVAAWRISNE